MTVGPKVLGFSPSRAVSSPAPRGARRERWLSLRDVLGGALLVAAWIALWSLTWAAVAGPLRPDEPPRGEVAAAAART